MRQGTGKGAQSFYALSQHHHMFTNPAHQILLKFLRELNLQLPTSSSQWWVGVAARAPSWVIAQEISRVLGALCLEPGTKTNIYCNTHLHLARPPAFKTFHHPWTKVPFVDSYSSELPISYSPQEAMSCFLCLNPGL